MASTRMKGTNIRFEVATDEEGTYTDYNGDISSLTVTAQESEEDFQTFAQAAAGGNIEWVFAITLVQSGDSTSLWQLLYENSGSDLYFKFNPAGAATASADKPDYTGKFKATKVGLSLGGDAGADNTFTSDVELTAESWTVDTGA